MSISTSLSIVSMKGQVPLPELKFLPLNSMQLSLKLHTRPQLPEYPDMDQATHKVTSKSRSVRIYEWIRKSVEPKRFELSW